MHKILIIIGLIGICANIYCQEEAYNWYFGEQAGLSFAQGDPVALTDGALYTGEGCSAISSSSGELQLYSDGRFVYDRNHSIMPNGSGLLGHSSSTQSCIIVPKPANNSQYYVFTVDAKDNGLVNGLCYSLVDMTLNGGLGDVSPAEKNISLLPYTCEKVTAVRHNDGASVWVITHQWGSNAFYSFLVTAEGVNMTPVISHAGQAVSGDMEAAKGYIKVSPDGARIAMANNTAFTVGIFSFDDASGVVSHIITDDSYVNPGGSDPGGPYGVEFSPESDLLYISEWKTNRKISQYDLSSNDPQTILNSRVTVATVNQNADPFGAIQLAPDKRLYIARMGSNYMSAINFPDTAGPGCNFNDNAIELTGGNSRYGLPAFVQSYFNDIAAFTATPLKDYAPLTVQFTDLSSGSPTGWKWDFENDGTFDAFIQNPSHTYDVPGIYTVKLTALYGFASDVAMKTNYISAAGGPELCLVTVTSEDANKLVWEKQTEIPVNYFNIYRETSQPGEYEVIGTVDYEDSCVFADTTANPQEQPYKYRLSAFSLQGTESLPGNLHSTVHLSVNSVPGGCELEWTPYEGFVFDKYYIYRGNEADNLTLLDSAAGGVNSFTDADPPFGPLFYAIEIILDGGCFPGGDEIYHTSRSNAIFAGNIGIPEDAGSTFRIFPNPVHDILNIQAGTGMIRQDAEVSIYSVYGIELISCQLTTGRTAIDIRELAPGIYFINLRSRNQIKTGKFVVQ
ncbi:MAG: T9SS type A sorting domain-containing protein [Bacteroidales bacterium]|jgi:PKD repeat protein|nr:T9SS type A sorting domain-containing protein [Bacteroidales bacterium]